MSIELKLWLFYIATVAVGIFFAWLLVYTVRKALAGFEPHEWLTLLIVYAGIALGALIGGVCSPGDGESETFNTIATLTLTLLSGVIFTSLAAGVDAAKVFPPQSGQASSAGANQDLPRGVALVQLYGFVAGLAIGGMTLYVFRAYPPREQPPAVSTEAVADKLEEIAKWVRSAPRP